ncbi:MAG: hypothetical protein KDD51_06895 [Bdellovibrionales bacterium]|nr:hypothetical protein [Bdellovibrionales bacterium]
MSVIGVVLLLLAPLWIAIGHSVVLRSRKFGSVPAVPLTTMICTATVIFLWLTLAITEGPRYYRNATPTLFTLCLAILGAHFYFHVFNMSESSRRIRLLRRLLNKQSMRETTKEYTPAGMYQARLERLVSWKQVTLRAGTLYPKASILSLAAHILHILDRLMFPERFIDPLHEDPEVG